MKSSSQHSFAVAPSVDIPRSSFKRNYNYKTTMNAGWLVPVVVDEVLPGDTFNFKLSAFARILSPLSYPIIDNLYLDFQFFYVPVRLVWDDYEKFFGSSTGREGNYTYDDSTLVPQVAAPHAQGWGVGGIADFFGLPIGIPDFKVNALPFRCYNKIIGDWYRPSSYTLDLPVVNTSSSDDSYEIYHLCRRLKRCDYFTSALPDTQRGNGVELPLGTTAPVYPNGIKAPRFILQEGEIYPRSLVVGQNNNDMFYSPVSGSSTGGTTMLAWHHGNDHLGRAMTGLEADLSHATAVTINDLRMAFQLQRALERDMRGGVTYRDVLMSHFSVRSPDARLQRSEYLGGGSIPISIHTVANTTGTDTSAQGKLSAYGVAGDNGIGFVKSFVEHGYIIGLASVRADLTYQQGCPRMFNRRNRFDFYWPVFSHLGEQAVLNKEIYAQGTDADDDVFAYQERYAEYRYGVSKITGQLRSTYAQTLDSWHLAQKFDSLPTLNSTFLEENPPMNRVKAVTSAPDFLLDMLVACNCVRPLPLFSVPGLADHF